MITASIFLTTRSTSLRSSLTLLSGVIGLGFLSFIVPGQSAKAAETRRTPGKTQYRVETSTTLTLGGIDSESDDHLSLVNVRFNKKPTWTKLNDLQDHGTYLQLILPNTTVDKLGEFFEGNSPFIQKIAAFQLTPSTAGVRLFTTENAGKTKRAATIELIGKRVVISIDHTQMQRILAEKTTLLTQGAARSAAANTVIAPATKKLPATITKTASSDAEIAAANDPANSETTDETTDEAPTTTASEANAAAATQTDDLAAVYKTTLQAAPKEVQAAAPAIKETPIGQDEIPALAPHATEAAAKAAEAVIANTTVRRDIPEPAQMVKSEVSQPIEVPATVNAATTETTETKEAEPAVVPLAKTTTNAAATNEKPQRFGSAAPDLRGRLVQVSIFSGVMLLILAGLWLVKPYLRKRGQTFGGEPIISMKTLATLPLAAKQKISLIQVGDEQILVGVTPENVTFITTIKSSNGRSSNPSLNPNASNFAKLLAEPEVNPQATFELKPSPYNQLSQTNQTNQNSATGPRERAALEGPKMNRAPARNPQPSTNATSATTNRVPTRPTASTQTTEAPTRAARPQGRINVSIGDDGITDHRSASTRIPTDSNGDGQSAIDDVTKMIRDKLKNLRSI